MQGPEDRGRGLWCLTLGLAWVITRSAGRRKPAQAFLRPGICSCLDLRPGCLWPLAVALGGSGALPAAHPVISAPS